MASGWKLPAGGRRYWRDVTGHTTGFARYIKEVSQDEQTLSVRQEIYDPNGVLSEIHHIFPIDTGHQKVQNIAMITRQTVADRIADYLHRGLTLAELLAWAEDAMNEGELEDADAPLLASVIARLGVADVREFGLTWEECDNLLRDIGYQAKVDIVKA